VAKDDGAKATVCDIDAPALATMNKRVLALLIKRRSDSNSTASVGKKCQVAQL